MWTLDRIIVPEASDHENLQYPFGMMSDLPKSLPVISRGKWFQGMPLIPWLAAKTEKLRIGMSIIDTPYRSPGVLAAELATQDQYHGEFADFELSGFGHQPLQKPGPPIYFSGLKDPKRSAKRIAKYGLQGWIGIQDSPEDIAHWKGEMSRELGELDRDFPAGFDMCSMIWFVITDEPMDQSPAGKATNLLAGSAQQIEDRLKRYREAGMTMPLLWPPFRDVPTAKTMDDLKRLTEEIMPRVNAM